MQEKGRPMADSHAAMAPLTASDTTVRREGKLIVVTFESKSATATIKMTRATVAQLLTRLEEVTSD
jgi:hypothetical protein